jgi:hypothetical protein
VTNKGNELFGEVVGGIMRLIDIGQIVAQTWEWLPEQYPYVELDSYIVMPNHFHSILRIIEFTDGCRGGLCATLFGCARPAPVEAKESIIQFVKIKPLGQLIGAFKTISAKHINRF